MMSKFGERTYPDGTTNYHWVLEYDTGAIGYYDTTHRREIFKTANEAIETGEKFAFKKRFHLRKVILN